MRPWYRIHFSTLFVLAIVLAWLVFVNIPGDRLLKYQGRFHHGWPYHYFERTAAERSWWSFAGVFPQFHAGALALNILTAFCIVALAAWACEIWIRRFGRLLRFSIASMLIGTAILAAILGLVVQDIHHCYRQQRTLDELAALGSVRAMRDERKYDWFRSLFGSHVDGTIHRIDVTSVNPVGAIIPDLSALDGLNFLHLSGVAIGEQDVEHLATAPNLGTLILGVHAVKVDQTKILRRIAELPVPTLHLGLHGDSFDDASVMALSSDGSIKHLGITSSRVTESVFRHLGEMKSLAVLWIEGSQLRDADFSLLAKAPKLGQVIVYRCSLSQRDEDNLRTLWPDGNLQTEIGPDGKSKLLLAFRAQRTASVDQAPGPQ